MSEREKREAFVTLATNDTYSLGCLVLGNSLRRVGTTRQLVVMVTVGVSNPMRTQLAQVFDLIQEVNLLDSQDPVNLSLLGRPDLNVTFTKLHCWRLTQYDKAVFLDADTLVLQNVDELFDREELSAAPDAGWPDCFNSGVFVFKPSQETYESLLNFATSQGSFDGGDQGLLNMYFSDWATKDIAKHLPFIYNVVSQAFYSYLPAFTQFKDRVRIVHFIGAVKPWHHTYNTSTRMVTPLPGTGHSQEFLQVWWNIFMSMVQPSLDPTLKRRRAQLLPTIVVSHPHCARTYAYIPKSNLPVIKLDDNTPWSWSKSFWCSPIRSSMYCCKTALMAFSRCWQSKPKDVSKQDELTTTTLFQFEETVEKQSPENVHTPLDDTIQTIFPFKPPKVDEVFYEVEEVKHNETEGTDGLHDEPKVVDLPFVPRSYTELESHYAEEPISSINPDSPPTSLYTVTKTTEGWEKGKSSPEREKPLSLDHKVKEEHIPDSSINDGTKTFETPLYKIDKEKKEPSSPTKVDGDTTTSINETLTTSNDTADIEVGLITELSTLSIQGAPSGPTKVLSAQERKYNWEKGQIDYLGEDSFDNIQKKIEASLNSEEEAPAPVATSLFTPATAPVTSTVPKKPATTSTKPVVKKTSLSITMSSKKK